MNNSHVEDLIIKKEKLTNGNSKENGTNTKVVQIAKLVKEMLEILNPNADNENNE
jgi:hypothetical protein